MVNLPAPAATATRVVLVGADHLPLAGKGLLVAVLVAKAHANVLGLQEFVHPVLAVLTAQACVGAQGLGDGVGVGRQRAVSSYPTV